MNGERLSDLYEAARLRDFQANVLANKIAYQAARSDIECHCAFTGTAESGLWYDTTCIGCDASEADAVGQWVADAVRYLDLRRLIERDQARPHVVRIKDDSQEQRFQFVLRPRREGLNYARFTASVMARIAVFNGISVYEIVVDPAGRTRTDQSGNPTADGAA